MHTSLPNAPEELNLRPAREPEFQTSFLASSPDCFEGAQHLVTFRDWTETNPTFELTNFGVSIELPLLHLHDRYFVAILNCAREPPKCVGILLYAHTLGAPVFSRIHNYPHEWPMDLAKAEGKRQRVFISEPREMIFSSYESIVSGCLLRRHLTEKSKQQGYRIEGCLYDRDPGNGLGLPGWMNRHWSRPQSDLNELEKKGKYAAWSTFFGSSHVAEHWDKLWHPTPHSHENAASFQVPGNPKVLVAAFVIHHRTTDTSFLVLIGTGARPELVHVDCYFPDRDFSPYDQNLASLASELRESFNFGSEARYSQDSAFADSHDVSFEFTDPRGVGRGGRVARGASYLKHYIRLLRDEGCDTLELQLEIMTEEFTHAPEVAVSAVDADRNSVRPGTPSHPVYRLVVGHHD